jgi:hypothetical protein
VNFYLASLLPPLAELPQCSFGIPQFLTIVLVATICRILANRQSAQRSRVRKLQYISELERSVTSLQVRIMHNSYSYGA